MAGAPIEIGIASETKAFRQGVQSGIIEPLEDAADKLDDLGKNKGPEKLERELESAQKATKQLGREVDRTADDIEKDFRDAYRDVKKHADDAMHGSAESVGEFKRDAAGEFAEFASSTTGDMEDVADGVQGLLGGLASSIPGPVGIAAAGVAAIGGAALATVAANAEETKQRVSDAFNEMASDGIEAWKSAESFNQRLTTAYDEHEKEVQSIADLIGLNFETVAAAWAGDEKAVTLVNAAYADLKTNLRETAGVSTDAATATIRGWDGVLAPLNDTISAYDTAEQKANRLWEQLAERADEGTHQMRAYREEIDKIPAERTTVLNVEAETTAAERKLKQITQGKYTVVLDVQTGKSYGRF